MKHETLNRLKNNPHYKQVSQVEQFKKPNKVKAKTKRTKSTNPVDKQDNDIVRHNPIVAKDMPTINKHDTDIPEEEE